MWTATALVVGNMIGSGVFLLPASLGRFGAVSLVGWLFTVAGATVLALTFARLSRMVPRPGGIYAYARIGLGDLPGFLVAWGYWISICAGNAAIVTALVSYGGFFWTPLATEPLLGAATAVAVIWFLTWINARGVREAGVMQLVTTLLKLAPLVVIATAGLLYLDPTNFTPFNTSELSTSGAVAATATLTLWAFLGLESATVPAGHVDRPARTIPRATMLGTGLAAVVYVLGTVAVMGVIPPDRLASSTAPFADAASHMWGAWTARVVAAGAVISCFGALNGWILLQGQLPMAAAMDGLMPRLFARRSPRGTPVPALVVSSILVTAIVATNYTKGLVSAFTFVILLATLSTLLPYAFSSLSLIRLMLRQRHRNPRELGTGLATAALALLYSGWAIVGAGRDAVFWGLLLLIAGMPVYVVVTRRAGGESERLIGSGAE
jgi:APA family basic amino acid/polyamine antiporter